MEGVIEQTETVGFKAAQEMDDKMTDREFPGAIGTLLHRSL